jgi:GNAT superfamily N-acetyltransferase
MPGSAVTTSIAVRSARPEDAALIHALILELADYEKLAHAAVVSIEQVRAALFGSPPRAYCDIAQAEGEDIGFALWVYNFSTFVGRAGIWLEDLYVRPAARGRGAGKALLAHLARRCRDEHLGRLEWAVLNWNAPSIAFYDSLGADALSGWTTRRLDGAPLARLADGR